MKYLYTASTVSLLAFSLAAQGEARRDMQDIDGNERRSAASYCTAEQMLDMEVRLEPSAEARVEAAEDGEIADRPTGSVSDLVIDSNSGKVHYAVVSVGGFLGMGEHDVLVPCKALTIRQGEDNERWLNLNATVAQLEAQPEFDADTAIENGLATTIGNCQTALRTFEMDRDGERAVEASMDRDASYCLNSQLADCTIMANGEEFGSISQCILDHESRKVAYLLISHGGVLGIGSEEIIVPMSACNVRKTDDGYVLSINKSVQELEGAVAYAEPDSDWIVLDPAAAKRADEFFGVNDRTGDHRDR